MLMLFFQQISAYVLSGFSHVRLFSTLWTIARQAPLSMGFSRQEYWSGLPFPSPGDLPDPGIEHMSLTFPALTGSFFTTSATWEALSFCYLLPKAQKQVHHSVVHFFKKKKSTASLLFPQKSQYLVFLSSSFKKNFGTVTPVSNWWIISMFESF